MSLLPQENWEPPLLTPMSGGEQGWAVGRGVQCVYVCFRGYYGTGECPHAFPTSMGSGASPCLGWERGQCPWASAQGGLVASTGVAPAHPLPRAGC